MSNQAMTNDKQIEVWRDEFAKAIGHNYTVRSDGRYVDVQIDNVWQGFLLAKRSMPQIELPNNAEINHLAVDIAGEYDWNTIEAKDKYIKAFTDGALVACDSIYRSITAAGYSYRVKE